MDVYTAIQIMINTIIDYLSFNRVLALLTAFFIAGGVSSLLNRNFILKYFGESSLKSYLVASVSGAILTVCSCTIIPLFASLYKRGAKLGPAVTFLFSGPGINILAIFYSAALLGWDFGIYRGIMAIIIAIIIGVIMDIIFKESSNKKLRIHGDKISDKPLSQIITFFGIMLLMLIVITASPKIFPFLSLKIVDGILLKHVIFFILLGILVYISNKYFTKRELKSWIYESYVLIKTLFPLLLIGVGIAGLLKVIIPPKIVAQYVGENTLMANFISSLIGATMYFATLTEVPIVKALLDLGMNKGPAMALLLSGPSLSIATLLALIKIMKKKGSCMLLFTSSNILHNCRVYIWIIINQF